MVFGGVATARKKRFVLCLDGSSREEAAFASFPRVVYPSFLAGPLGGTHSIAPFNRTICSFPLTPTGTDHASWSNDVESNGDYNDQQKDHDTTRSWTRMGRASCCHALAVHAYVTADPHSSRRCRVGLSTSSPDGR
jgi:hypothetical protein